jgi:hypothetical protein
LAWALSKAKNLTDNGEITTPGLQLKLFEAYAGIE